MWQFLIKNYILSCYITGILYVRIPHITAPPDAKGCNKKKTKLSSIFGRNAIKGNPLMIPITKERTEISPILELLCIFGGRNTPCWKLSIIFSVKKMV